MDLVRQIEGTSTDGRDRPTVPVTVAVAGVLEQ